MVRVGAAAAVAASVVVVVVVVATGVFDMVLRHDKHYLSCCKS